jgi:hypothetical protein
MLRAFTAWRRRTLFTIGLAAAALSFAAAVPKGNAGATSPADSTRQLDQLGPKYLLDPRSAPAPSIPATERAGLVDEFGPKYLLEYELKTVRP